MGEYKMSEQVKAIFKRMKPVCPDCKSVYSVVCPNKTHLGEKKLKCRFYGIDPNTEKGKKSLLYNAEGKSTTVEKHYRIYDKYHAY